MSDVQENRLPVSGNTFRGYRVRLTFEDLKFIVDWLGSGEVEPGEGCIFLASPEEKSMVRGVSRDILWSHKYSGQVLRKLDCSIVQS